MQFHRGSVAAGCSGGSLTEGSVFPIAPEALASATGAEPADLAE
jgi:hypothetical protein